MNHLLSLSPQRAGEFSLPMRPKGKAPPNRAANRSRREEPRRPVAATSSSGAPPRQASRSVDPSNARRPPPKGGARRHCVAPLAETRVRRYVLSALSNLNAPRSGAQFPAPRTPEQRPIYKRSSLSPKCVAPGPCLPRPLGFNYPLRSPNCKNRFAPSNVVPSERARSQKRKSNAWCGNDKCPAFFAASDSKPFILNKTKSNKSPVTNTFLKHNFSQLSCNDKVCIVGQVQTKFDRDVKETARENRATDIARTIPALNNESQDNSEKTEEPDGNVKEVCDSDLSSVETDVTSLLPRDSLSSQKSLISHVSLTRSHESILSQESPKSCDSFGVINGPLGWERVLLSLQVQMSPISSPTSSSTNLEDASSIPRKQSSKSHRKFQTTSEIMVLPILASHQDEEDIKMKGEASDPENQICFTSEAPMKDLLDFKINDSREGKLTDMDSSKKTDISEEREELGMTLPGSIEHQSRSKTTCEVSDVIAATAEKCKSTANSKTSLVLQEERSPNDTDRTFGNQGIKKNNDPVNKCSSHSPPENAVAELQLNQNDIVKMAYEIIDIVSQIHVSNSNTSENAEADTELRKRSVELSFGHSESSNLSVSTVQSIGKFSDSDTEIKKENLSSSIENISTNNNDRKMPSNSDSTDSSGDTESETSEINIINTFRIPKELPMLLYQNKQVNKLLREFTAKLEENEKDSLTLGDPKKHPSEEKMKEHIINIEQEADTEDNMPDEMINGPIEDKKYEDYDPLNNMDKQDLKMQTTEENAIQISIEDECINIKCLQTTADQTVNQELWINYESTASDADTEKSIGVHSEADAEDGDDEATGSASDAAVEEVKGLLDTSADDPIDGLICSCKDTHESCPQYPDEEDELILEGTCICERFKHICTEDHPPPTADSQVEMSLDSDPETQLVNNESDRVISDETASTSANVSKSASWVPWVRTNGNEDGPRIPDFNPGPTENASSITIPPHQVANTTNLLQKQDNVSEFSSGGSANIWDRESIKDNVPGTITEYHWMPEDVRAFSSTMIYPEIPDDAPFYNPDNRPQLYVRHSFTPEPSVSGFILQTSSAKPSLIPSDAGRMTINPDAPAEVPGASYGPNFDVSVGGNLFDILSIAVEKSISPLKYAIDELKMKIDRMETTHMASVRPDILVGVTSVSTCQGRTGTSDSCDVHGASTCVPPFGIYVLHQRSSVSDNVPLGANVGNAIQGSSQWPDGAIRPILPCNRCVEKFKMISTPSSANSSPSGIGGNIGVVPPPSPFLSPNEASVSGGRSSLSRVPEEAGHTPQLKPEDQMNPRCKCPKNMQINGAQNDQMSPARIAGEREPVSENEKCTKCRICNPSEHIVKSTDESGPLLASPKCVGCCKPPYKTERPDRDNRQQEVQQPNQQNLQQKEQLPKQQYIPHEGQQAGQPNIQQEGYPSDLQEQQTPDRPNHQQGDEPQDQQVVNYQQGDELQDQQVVNNQEEDEPPDQHNRQQEEQRPDQENRQQEELQKETSEDPEVSENRPEQSEEDKKHLRRDSQTSGQNHQSQACGTCKTCLPIDPSFDPSSFKRTFRSPSQIPCHKCCTCPLLIQKTSSELPWQRFTKCPGCSRCPFPPPCPPPPPTKPPLSPIAQMYLDMSRAKHDWSDKPKDKGDEEEDVCVCSKHSCPGISPGNEGEQPPEGEISESKLKGLSEGEAGEGDHPEGEPPDGEHPEEKEPLEEKDSDPKAKKKCCAFLRKRKKSDGSKTKKDKGK